jgi:hypothetical protein
MIEKEGPPLMYSVGVPLPLVARDTFPPSVPSASTRPPAAGPVTD